MPKIQHIARFTKMTPPEKKLTTIKETTPISKKTLPDKLRSRIDEQRKDHALLLDLLVLSLEESEQPLTATEVSKLIELRLNKNVDPNTVRLYLQELKAEGRISSRVETFQERRVRANGFKVRALHANLWWAPAGDVPERTITEAVPGVVLSDSGGRKPGKKNKSSAAPASISSDAISDNNPVIEYLIEKIVAERTCALQEELDTTKAELERLQRKIRSLVGEI